MKNNMPIDVNALLDNVFGLVKKTLTESGKLISNKKDTSPEEKEKSESILNEMQELSNQEIMTLFKDWIAQVSTEINDYMEKNKTDDIKKIAKAFQISEESVEIFLKAIQKAKG